MKKSINSSNSLTSKIQKSMGISAVVKGLAVIVSFIMMRISREYLDSDDVYGVWLTILSTMSWINLLDIGLGNGLRNKVAIEIANEKYEESKKYVSTTYTLLSIIALIVMAISMVVTNVIDLRKLFNITTVSSEYFNLFIQTVIFLNLGMFVFNIIKSICYALNDAFLPGIMDLISNIMSIIFIFIFMNINIRTLTSIGSIYFGFNLLVILVFTFLLFKTKFKKISPNIKKIDLSISKELMGTGIMFFFVQIGSMIIFTTDSLIISNFLGPKEVIPYQLIFKLYSIFTLLAGIIMTPLWSAFTHAYTKKDYIWIKDIIRKLILLIIPLVFGVVIVFIFRNIFTRIWMGESIIISNILGILMGISTIITIWSNIFAYFLNGIGELKIQLITVGIGAVINIPLSYIFSVTFNMGNAGVILATIVSLSLFAVLGPIHVYRILNTKIE